MRNQTKTHRHLARLILAGATLLAGTTLFPAWFGLALAQTASPSWSYTRNLNTARAGHTATLLPNGKVLVAGGGTVATVLNSAELYDPVSGKWSVTGSLNSPRYLFTATLLSNGKVLVAGGYSSFGLSAALTNTAELYDPATGTWTPTGNLNVTRTWHSAARLRNGKVIVVGGWDGSSLLNTAELYNPETGTWSLTGSLNTPRGRFAHTVTVLQNGQALVAGGSDDEDFGSSLTDAELYDPNTGTWSTTGSMNAGRNGHTATILPDGNVLVAAGHGFPCSGGFCFSTVNTSAELYNPATGTWSRIGNLSRRSDHTATLLPNGEILFAGGWNAGYDIGRFITLDTAETYDPANVNWKSTANLNAARYFHTATLLLNGKVLVVGGFDNSNGSLRSAELYDSGGSSLANPIDDVQFFVRQHYLDFLNREPDTEGIAFWTNEIASCGSDQQCIDVKRINVSAAFFLSIEFQQTGYLVYRLYKAAYGNLPGAPVPITFSQFLRDTREISQGVVVKQDGWEQVLENNKQVFISEFVQRAPFTTAFSTMTPADFVDELNTNAGNPLSQTERNQLISDLTTAAKTRAQVLRAVAENQTLVDAEFNRAFVLMQYFGYLRRNPNAAPDVDYSGYNFWLAKLNNFNGDFFNAEMVKAFIQSTEYRQRFGP